MNEWLKQRRLKLNINQEDLAARLVVEGHDVSRSMISHWENGKNKLPLHDSAFRQALAKSLRMTEADILREAGYKTGATSKRLR